MSIIRIESPQSPQSVRVVDENIVKLYNIDSFAKGFGTNGFQFDDNEIAMFAIRVKPNTTRTIKITHYEICGTETAAICGYRWYESPTLSAAVTWTDLTSEIQYAFFTETGNTPTTISVGGESTVRHAGIFTGKDNSSEEEIGNVELTDGANPNVLVLALRHLNGTSATGAFLSVNIADLG